MQLIKRSLKKPGRNKSSMGPKISSALATATCSLLSVTASHSALAEEKGWQVDGALLLYQETDRVEAVEPSIMATKRFANDSILNLKVVLDSLTGASPNGASATNQAQTYTRPSGNGSFVTPAGEIPLDDTFKDSRTQFGIGYERPVGDDSRFSVGLNVSGEYDYQSFGISGSWQQDFNKRNTTLLFGLAFASDTMDPHGGIPIPFSSMLPAGNSPNRQGSDEDKQVTDVIFGVTQVINRNTLMQLNYSYSQTSGYQTDPFKVVSIIDSNTGATLDNIYENRPEDRTKHSIFWKTKYHTPWHDTLDFSLRAMSDDWGIDSTTADFHYRWNISPRVYLEPHLRFYSQTAADFYRHSLPNNVPLDEFLSADYRLAEFDATTVGAKLGYRFSDEFEISMRLEQYKQTGDTNPSDAIGLQTQFDLFPDLDANIVQFGFSYRW